MNEIRKVLFKKPNVNGFGFGKLVRNGKETGEGIVVTVTKKLSPDKLSAKDMIPRMIDDIPTDVVEVGEIKLLGHDIPWPEKNEDKKEDIKEIKGWHHVDRTKKFRPVPLGVSVGNICVRGETRVITENGLKKIMDIKIGEKVLTHKNRFKKVVKVFKRRYVGQILKFRVADPRGKQCGWITITPNHPVLIYDKKMNKPNWIEAKDLEIGDYVFVQASKCKYCGEPIPYFYEYCNKHYATLTKPKVRTDISIKHSNRLVGSNKHYYEDILPAARELEKQGFRVIPIGKAIPDIIAIKDNKVFAVEVENLRCPSWIPNYDKYPNEISAYVDDIMWIIKRKEPKHNIKKIHYVPNILDGFVAIPIAEKQILNIPERRSKNRPSKFFVYNLEVEEDNTYVTRNMILHNCITAGTSGFLVKKDDEIMMVSNNHVFACVNKCEIGSLIVQPGTYDTNNTKMPENRIGTLYEYVPIKTISCPYSNAIVSILNFLAKLVGSKFRFQYKPVDFSKDIPKNKVDCALCLLDDPDIAIPKPLEIDTDCYEGLADVEVGDIVIKTGRTTGVTLGTVRATNYECRVAMNKEMTEFAYFEDQLLIEHIPDKFSAPGDSGSGVGKTIEGNLYLVGLLFAGSDKVTVVNKIYNVFEALHLNPDSLVRNEV